ncbi:hypothetical protein J5N97_005193 [Dioscorea zingiberensis]|uniref:protein acetyllysine N-acetyltransferase n=1 Tax=Dioscorea zingiberensis TaxID=325984 RepID=A0A9D5HSW2_9LILI|nr:hypothetical protein J5N97_005193 [Dioscorea zingiberensis]
MALVELERAGILKFVISQNVDCLHLRSGIPRQKLAELHGNSFRELCPSCGEEYVRDFEIETIGMKVTSRRCSNSDCGAKLRDTVLDWEDALPPKEMNLAEKHCRTADIVLCLGTSLQITPACNLPLKSIIGGGKIVIVNLQVIAGVMQLLDFRIPPYIRIDLVQLILRHVPKSKVKKESFTFGKNNVLQELMDVANKESQCGQHAIIERKVLPRSEITIDAIVTNLVKYNNAENTKPVEAIPIANTNGIKRCSASTKGTRTSRKRSKLA